MENQKLLIIGLDGADKQALIDGINRDRLPQMAKIARKGGISTLKAPVPPVTPVSMASMLTGEEPGKHGVYGFEQEGDYVDHDSIQTDTLFDRLDEEGLETITVNVPMTSPLPDSVDVGVSGFPISDPEFAKPFPVREKLREIDYQVEPSEFEDGEEEFVDEVFDLAEKRFQVSLDLIDRDWNVFFLMFTGDARLQHFIDDEETITRFYEKVDRYIGELRESIGEDVEILVVSDHGFSQLETRFDIGEWLSQEGYMTEAPDSDTSKLYGKMEDRPDAQAYPAGAYLSGIYADEDVRGEIVEKLGELEYDGRKVFRDVYLSEDLYGENDGPDIIPVPRRSFSHVAGYSGELFTEDMEEVKVPDREGVVLSSFGIEDGAASMDVLPTVLDYFGIGFSGSDNVSLLDD